LLVGHGTSILCPAAQQIVHQHTNVHVFTVLPVVVLETILPVAVLVKTVILESIKVKKAKLLALLVRLENMVTHQVLPFATLAALVNTKNFLMVHRAKTAVPVNTLPVQRSHVKVVKVENFKRQHQLPSTLVNFVQLAKNLPQKVPRVSIV
jgi:hypothetical protein